jgi:hypothetical protein
MIRNPTKSVMLREVWLELFGATSIGRFESEGEESVNANNKSTPTNSMAKKPAAMTATSPDSHGGPST